MNLGDAASDSDAAALEDGETVDTAGAALAAALSGVVGAFPVAGCSMVAALSAADAAFFSVVEACLSLGVASVLPTFSAAAAGFSLIGADGLAAGFTATSPAGLGAASSAVAAAYFEAPAVLAVTGSNGTSQADARPPMKPTARLAMIMKTAACVRTR